METLKDVLSAARNREGVALRFEGRRTPHSAAEFATACHKAGNLLRHYGVHPGADCAVVLGAGASGGGTEGSRTEDVCSDNQGLVGSRPTSAPLTALLGAATIGATADLTPSAPVEARALVHPAGREGEYDTAPQCSILAYGDRPDGPEAAHFESERWSQNPVEPPESPAPTDSAVRIDGEPLTHEELLNAVGAVVEDTGLAADQWVVLDESLADSGALVAGLLAPLAVGAPVFVRVPDGSGAGSLPDEVEPVAYRVQDMG